MVWQPGGSGSAAGRRAPDGYARSGPCTRSPLAATQPSAPIVSTTVAAPRERLERLASEQDTIALDVPPQRLAAAQPRRHHGVAHLEVVHGVAGDAPCLDQPRAKRVVPSLVVFVGVGSAHDQHVDVALGIRFAAGDRTESTTLAGAGRIAPARTRSRSIFRPRGSTKSTMAWARRFSRTSRYRDDRGHVTPLHDAGRNETWEHSRRLRRAHPCQARNRLEVELGRGACEHVEHPALRAGDQLGPRCPALGRGERQATSLRRFSALGRGCRRWQ